MEIQYKANLTKLGTLAPAQKFDSCVITVSVGQTAHENEKFKATLKLINERFRRCSIGVCDTLQRHSLSILSDLNSNDLFTVAKHSGDQWISRNIDYCNQILKIPFKIIRWDEWLNSSSYSSFRLQVEQLYKDDKQFNNIVVKIATSFNDKLLERGYNFDHQKGTEKSIEYILEECAAMCQWYSDGYSVEVYPSVRNEAIEYTFSVLMKDKGYGKLVLPAGLNFKKIASSNNLADDLAIKKILDVIPGHVYWKDLDGTFLGCNRRQAENYGFKDESSIIGKKDDNFLKSKIAEQIQANDKEIITKNEEKIIEETTYVKDGKKQVQKTFLSHKMPMHENSGNIIGTIGVSIDITELKKLQQNLIKKTKELSNALDHKRDFLNTLSHEIRTPLHIMGSITAELKENMYNFSSEELNSFIDVLAENNHRLMKLLTHLLDSAKNIKGQNNYIFKKSDIVTSCINCIREFHRLADISFTCDQQEILIEFDDIKISQVLRNILDNAIKYGLDKKIAMEASLINNNSDILISISNRSAKINQAEKSKLFNMFFQGSAAKKMQNGVGLGLSICKEIVEAHKGKIWIDNSDELIKVNFTLPTKQIL